ncbi:MAG TPA: hypothetical protein PJ991_05815 [Kiritimatiellia bacterium]|nr:hypothetical protein [Kiritimatiellia bacterium]
MRSSLIIALMGLTIAFGATVRAESETTKADEADAAIMCPKCETVWVKTVSRQGRKAETYVSTKKMKCEDCKNAVESFIATGEFKHTCKTCGDMVMCKVHPEPTSGPAPSDTKFVPGPGHEKK